MKKKIISALLATALVLSLAGCGGAPSGTAGSGSTSGAAVSGEKTVIEVWTNDRHDLDYVTAKIEEFNASNTSNIEIKQTVVTDDYINMLSMARSSGTAPDLAGVSAGMSGFDIKVFVDSGMVMPLTDYIAKAGEDFEKVTATSQHIFEGINAVNGEVYWVPTVVRSGCRMIYNKEMVEAAGVTQFPNTVEGMVELAKTITANGGGSSYGFASTSSAPFIRCFEGIAEMSGQNRYGYDYVNGKFDFSGFKPVLEAFQPMLSAEALLPGSNTQGVDAMRAQFADGVVGIWANASQEAGVFTKQFPVDKFTWVTAELPTLDGVVKGALTAQPQKGYVMLSDTENPDAAWEVMQFFCSEAYIKGYLENGFALPFSEHMTSVVDNSKAGRIADFAMKEYESIYPTAPSVAIEGDNLQVVLWSAAMGERGIDEAIEDLNTRYNAALEQDISMGKVKRLIIKDFDALHPSEGTVEYLDK